MNAGRLEFDTPHKIYNMALDVDRVIIERAQAAPGQGISAAFEYGRAFGRVETAVMQAVDYIYYVSPSWWKGRLGIPTDKKKAVEIALKTTPRLSEFIRLESDDGVAEAALMAQILMSEKYFAELVMNNKKREAPKKRRASFTWDEPPST